MASGERLPSGRYRARWRDQHGRRISPPGLTFATKTAARKYAQDREAEIRRGEYRDPHSGRLLLREWVEQWQASRVAEHRTLGKEAAHVRLHILQPVGDGQALGDLPLDRIDEMTVQAWVKRLQASGLAPSTVVSVYRTLGAILRPAVRARRLPVDPLLQITLPTVPPGSDFHWTREEADAIREQLHEPRDLALFELLLGTGMRWGEAAGLHLPRWQPLRRRVAVVEVLVERQGYRLKAYPKGKHRRELPVAQRVVDAMAQHLAVTSAAPCGLDHGRAACGGLVFHADGRPLSRHAWSRTVFPAALAAAQVRPGRVHDLRHTYASWLVLDGVPLRVVQELLGHASIRTTERYAHLAPSALDDPRLTASLEAGGVGRIVGQIDAGPGPRRGGMGGMGS